VPNIVSELVPLGYITFELLVKTVFWFPFHFYSSLSLNYASLALTLLQLTYLLVLHLPEN